MQKIKQITGQTIPLAMNDVDTDLIIPAQYLTSVDKKGYGKHLFTRLRQADPDFVFNRDIFAKASILIAKENFGCGSSREHAVWALLEAGIKAIIAASFSDIFYNNSAKNGLVLIMQPLSIIEKLIAAANTGHYELTIDIETQNIITADATQLSFSLDSFHQYCFLNGLDELDYLLAHTGQINQHVVTRAPYNFITDNNKEG